MQVEQFRLQVALLLFLLWALLSTRSLSWYAEPVEALSKGVAIESTNLKTSASLPGSLSVHKGRTHTRLRRR